MNRTRIWVVCGHLAVASSCSTVPDERSPDGTGPATTGATGPAAPEPDPDPPGPDPDGEPPTGTTGASDPSDDSHGGVFIEDFDLRGPSDCDPWSQDCPPGQKCSAYASEGATGFNANRCVPIADDPGRPGAPCTAENTGLSGIDDCDATSMCWAVDPDTGTGYCAALCKGSPTFPMCDDLDSVCNILSDAPLNLCYRTCHPLAPICPSERETCVPALGGDAFICVPNGSGDEGAHADLCEFVNACNAGLWCAPAFNVPGCAHGDCCTEFCEVGLGDEQCTGQAQGQRCLPWFQPGQEPEPELANVGFCGVPL